MAKAKKDINKEIIESGGKYYKKVVSGETVIKAESVKFHEAMIASGWVVVDKSGRAPVGARKAKTAEQIENEKLRAELNAMKAEKAAAEKVATAEKAKANAAQVAAEKAAAEKVATKPKGEPKQEAK